MYSKKVVWFILLIIILYGCKNQDKDQYNKISIKSIGSIEEFTLDTSKVFVYLPLDISYQTKQDRFYVVMNDLVYVFDKNFNCIKQLGKKGPGPEEFSSPYKMYVKEANIFLTDYSKSELLTYNLLKNKMTKWKLEDPRSTPYTFSVDDDNIVYLNTPTLNNAVSGFSFPNFKNPKISFNIPSLIDKEKGWYRDSKYHILSTNNQVIAVSYVYPYIFFFDKKGNLTYTFTFPEELTSRMKFALNQKRRNPDNIRKDYLFVSDACLFNKKLYLLLNENLGKEEEWYCNKIVVISIEDPLKPEIESIIQLEERRAFFQISISATHIIASDEDAIIIYKNPLY